MSLTITERPNFQITDEAGAVCATTPDGRLAKRIVATDEACRLLAAASREAEETGYLPPDTVSDAATLARQAPSRSFVQKIVDERDAAEQAL